MSDPKRHDDSRAEPPVRDSGPVEGVRGNREVPPAGARDENEEQVEADEQSLEERLLSAEAKAEQHLDDLKRIAADFDNFRKRAARDQARVVERATERLVKELLPILDDLERALEAAEQHEEAKLEEGVRLVHRQLADALRREGLEEIATHGRFDPHVHEALLSQPSEAEEGTVIDVLQKGYRLGEHVVRPARVVVSAGGDDS